MSRYCFAVIVSLAAQHQKQIDALSAVLQKVSDQLQGSKPEAQVVNSP